VRITLRPVGELTGHVFVVVVAFDQDRLVLCRHRDRSSWETPGGHVEPGETPEEAARRELLEEAGITAGELTALADYDVDGVPGRAFLALTGTRVRSLHFEIAETLDVDDLPDDLTYPEITPALVHLARQRRAAAWLRHGAAVGGSCEDVAMRTRPAVGLKP
jgi:8-oxo-dGTP diphosphatase